MGEDLAGKVEVEGAALGAVAPVQALVAAAASVGAPAAAAELEARPYTCPLFGST